MRGRHLSAVELLRREQIECAVARWWPDLDRIMAAAEATVPELRTVIQHMKLMNREPDMPGGRPPMPIPQDALRAAHAAYVRGERAPEVLAGQRAYDRQRKRNKYQEHKRALAETDMVLIDRIYEPMLTEWQRTA